MTPDQIVTLRHELSGKSAQEALEWAFAHFSREKVALATSFGAEDQVLTDMVARVTEHPIVFTLDTGRLFQETYDTIDRTRERYGITIEVLFPDRAEVEAMVLEHGPNLFFESRELRKLCCQVRKVNVLRRKLAGFDLWITGVRREQAITRVGRSILEWDESFGLLKLNPLYAWSTTEVWSYIQKHGVPYNPLHDRDYPSIGCAPCTRAVSAGEDIRAGRWWWEGPEAKECGLHWQDGKPVRAKLVE
jgi:phosphoadenosine phosphosulfate reductase